MANTDTQPWVYNFKYSYYENFYRNRQSAMATTGSFNDMWVADWEPNDNLMTVDDGFGSPAAVTNGIEISWYVKKHFNGDKPKCLLDSIMDALTIAWTKAKEWVSDVFDSFICTATVEALGTECGRELLEQLTKYRDETMTDADGIAMLRYYSVLGPRIVREINADPDSDAVYGYLYVEYISKLPGIINGEHKEQVMLVYFNMLYDMCQRYDIPTSKRFTKWRLTLT